MYRGIEIIEEPRGLTLSQQVKDHFFNATHDQSELSSKLIEGNDLGHPQQYVVFTHGGAGSPNERIHNMRMVGTDHAAQLGERLIASGTMSPRDVAVQMVASMEYNIDLIAGIGSGPNKKGTYQFDAFVMEPTDMGIVTAIGMVKNPVYAASLVQKQTDSLHITGEDATDFAHDQELPFYLKREMAKGYRLGAEAREGIYSPTHDTVGAIVAAKWNGRWEIAAAGSTGGMPDKDGGRVGDCGHSGTGFWVAQEPRKSNNYGRVAAALVSGIGEATMLNITASGWVKKAMDNGKSILDGGEMNRIVRTNIRGKQGWGGMAGLYLSAITRYAGMREEQDAKLIISSSSPWFATAAYTNIPDMHMRVLPRVTGKYIRNYEGPLIPIYSSLS